MDAIEPKTADLEGEPLDESPPFAHLGVGTWPRLYGLVLIALGAWIGLFAWLTERYQ